MHILLIGLLNAKESPGFFIKVPKNIPRLGRRDGAGNNNDWSEMGSTIPKVDIGNTVSGEI